MCRHSKGAATNAVGDATDTARDGIAPEHIAPEHKEAAPSGRLIVREPREGLNSSLNVRPI